MLNRRKIKELAMNQILVAVRFGFRYDDGRETTTVIVAVNIKPTIIDLFFNKIRRNLLHLLLLQHLLRRPLDSTVNFELLLLFNSAERLAGRFFFLFKNHLPRCNLYRFSHLHPAGIVVHDAVKTYCIAKWDMTVCVFYFDGVVPFDECTCCFEICRASSFKRGPIEAMCDMKYNNGINDWTNLFIF
jgi:hypothetical protein